MRAIVFALSLMLCSCAHAQSKGKAKPMFDLPKPPQLENTLHVNSFGSQKGAISVLFAELSMPCTLAVTREGFLESASNLIAAWKTNAPVKVTFLGASEIVKVAAPATPPTR
jgi:hypothetical protein